MADEERGSGYDDERAPKSEAVRLLGIIPTNNDDLMARSRFNMRQIATLTMQETQEEALNPNRVEVFLSATWRKTLARNLYAKDGLLRVELQSVLETQSEERQTELAMRE